MPPQPQFFPNRKSQIPYLKENEIVIVMKQLQSFLKQPKSPESQFGKEMPPISPCRRHSFQWVSLQGETSGETSSNVLLS